MEDQLAELEDSKGQLSSQLMELADASAQASEVVQQQSMQLDDAKAQAAALLQEHRRAVGADPADQTSVELEAAALEQRTANRILLDGLTSLSANEPALAQALEAKMADAGIQPPMDDAELGDADDGDEGFE